MADLPTQSHPNASETEKELRRAYQQLATHVENTPLVVIEWDSELRVTRWNTRAEQVFGWTFEEVAAKNPLEWEFVYEEDRVPVTALLQRILNGQQPQSVMLNRNYTKSGKVIWCEWHNSVVYDETGKMVSLLSHTLDVTEQRTAAEQLVRSEARMRAALDGARMLGWDLDLVHNKWETTVDIPDFYGVPRGPDYKDPEVALHAVHPADVPIVIAGRRHAIETGEPLRYHFRGRIPNADGSFRWFATRGRVLYDKDGKPVRIVAVTSDITERKREEAEREAIQLQRRESQKWESLGVLAGGVAHDFNNILTVVLGSANLARRGLPVNSPAVAYLEQIESSCRRAADICQQMLAYAGRNQTGSVRYDVSQLVRESIPLLQEPAKPANLRYELDHRLPLAVIDAGQVRRVLVSLVANAAESYGGKSGEVIVQTTAVEFGENANHAAFQLAPAPGQYVCLAVTDRGSGISDEVRSRMFDPFYSTKFTGRGLGLAAVLGIVRAHRGALSVESAVGQGTRVCTYWPAPVEVVPSVSSTGITEMETQTATAIVIDDEMFVREVTASALEELGLRPVLAGDGSNGIALFLRHRDTIQIAVIDVVMPGISGEQVLRSLRGFAPELPAILVSGFTDSRAFATELNERTLFLQKPFHPEELMATVRKLLPQQAH
jgi:PAS domain S-box-containing protein